MSVIPLRHWLLPSVLVCASTVQAQDTHRIWGEVHTVSGDSYEGFIRWDKNEGSWSDILDGSKEIPSETYLAWLDARRGGEHPTRTIDLMGYRISWDEEDPDFPARVASGIRFGHLAGLTVTEGNRASLLLRSGERLELIGGSTDIGPRVRELVVDVPGADAVELDWEDLDRIVFSAPPMDVLAASPRLYGTVEDVAGRRFTGYVSWDLDEILESDILDGQDEEGRRRRIEFVDIRALEREDEGTRVTLASGETALLSGTNDVDRGHRGVQISDPGLGMVEVEWDEFLALRLHDPATTDGYDLYDGGHRLHGTVETTSGDAIAGLVRWDADAQWSWELLNGRSEEVSFTVELGKIRGVARDSLGAVVTLVDGRTFHLDDSNDVDERNRGLFIEPTTDAGPSPEDPMDWRYVPWDEFREVRFDHPVGPTVGAEDDGTRAEDVGTGTKDDGSRAEDDETRVLSDETRPEDGGTRSEVPGR